MATESYATVDVDLISKILAIRGYKIVETTDFNRIKDETGLTILAFNQSTGRKLAVLYAGKDVLGVAWVRELHQLMKEYKVTRGILYGGKRATPAARKAALLMRIEVLHITPLTYRLFDHEYVPQHRIAKDEELLHLLRTYKINHIDIENIIKGGSMDLASSKNVLPIIDSVLSFAIRPDGEFYPKHKEGGLLIDMSNFFINGGIAPESNLIISDGFLIPGNPEKKIQKNKLSRVKLSIITLKFENLSSDQLTSLISDLKKIKASLILSTSAPPKSLQKKLGADALVVQVSNSELLSRIALETGAVPIDQYPLTYTPFVGNVKTVEFESLDNQTLIRLVGCNNPSLVRFRVGVKKEVVFSKGLLGPAEDYIYNELQIIRQSKILLLNGEFPDFSTNEMDVLIAKFLELNVNVILSTKFFPKNLQRQLMKTGLYVITNVPERDFELITKLSKATPIPDPSMLEEDTLGTAQIMFETAMNRLLSIHVQEKDERSLDAAKKAIRESVLFIKGKIEAGFSTLLTYISRHDPVVMLLGAKFGDLIRIDRKSHTANTASTYRIVYEED